MSDEIDQKAKNVVNIKFFLRIFSPAHFNHWKLSPPVYQVTMVTMETMRPDMSVQLPDNVMTLTDAHQIYFRHHRLIYRCRKVDGWWWVVGKMILVSSP